MADIEKMVHFEEWAKDKTFLIRTAALQFALPSKDFHDALKKLKAGERMEGYDSLPPIDEWVKLYKNHGKVYLGLTNSLRQLDNRLSEIIDFYEELMLSLASLRHITQSEFQEVVDELKSEDQNGIFESFKEKFKAIENLIIEDHLEDSETPEQLSEGKTEKIQKFIRTPEVLFFVRVWAPCFLLYGDYPAYILRKARQGDEEAFEKLLRLDKFLIYEPKMKKIFKKATETKARGRMSLIAKAFRSTPKAKIEIKHIKYLFAGLLSLISIAIGQKLKAIDIHDLFDAIAQDTTGEQIDPDFIETPETFEKRIQRARDFWKIPIPLPDKK
ncbi:MAG: hypothetical protein PHY29_03590 [Syntrophales bacterium]|nr:hypothetical protein [Syntrophales bacterium]